MPKQSVFLSLRSEGVQKKDQETGGRGGGGGQRREEVWRLSGVRSDTGHETRRQDRKSKHTREKIGTLEQLALFMKSALRKRREKNRGIGKDTARERALRPRNVCRRPAALNNPPRRSRDLAFQQKNWERAGIEPTWLQRSNSRHRRGGREASDHLSI